MKEEDLLIIREDIEQLQKMCHKYFDSLRDMIIQIKNNSCQLNKRFNAVENIVRRK